MGDSKRQRSTASSIIQNPFQDTQGSGSNSISEPSTHQSRRSDTHGPRGSISIDPPGISDSIEPNEIAAAPLPRSPGAVHTRDSSSSSLRRQQQSRYIPPRSRYSDDEIQQAPSINPSLRGAPFNKPWLDRHTSLGDESTASSLSTRRPLPEPLDRSPKTVKAGGRWILFTKWVFIILLLSANGFFIFATWWWPKYYYVFLPLITITVALNVIMVFSIIFHLLFRLVVPEAKFIPEELETMVLLLPCYNETREELIKSLDSLVGQVGIEENKKAIMIICDGKARGPGMEKTTGAYLLEDILTFPTTREYITAAYTSWDHTEMDAVVQTGTYGGIPYMCIVKEANRGKRDSLILIRSFLYNFNIRETRPAVIQSDYFFATKVAFLRDAGFNNVDLLIGMDADTFFEPPCVAELIKQSHYKHTIGVCGYVAVDFGSSSWSLWRLYQNAEYTISQCLRRLHQSIATHKVSCLPGCCQLLKVCETTCGDRILLELFGYHPTAKDHLLKQIRATASEDRNHVCLMLSAFPKARTRQALKARAYTDVPHSWSVFLSQRRRWSLGATSNDLLLVFAPGILLFERILAVANVITWVLNFFIIACIASFIKACTFVHYSLILAFVSVMLVPVTYYIAIAVWHPRGAREKIQYLAGLAMYIFLGPFLNITVLLFALRGIDNFAWGKTRKVVETKEVGGNETPVIDEKSSRKLTKPQPVFSS